MAKGSTRLVVVLAVVVVLGLVLALKGVPPRGEPTRAAQGSVASLTATHNDAVADFAAALKAKKPIYVLFHSLTCDPCVQISAAVDQAMPDYADRVTFVNAITDDPSGEQLASRFAFQYIPTSFFLKADGTVVDSFTGVLSPAEIQDRLDALLVAK